MTVTWVERLKMLPRLNTVQNPRLVDALIGRKSFANFNDLVHTTEVREQWFDFKGRNYMEMAKVWIERNVSLGLHERIQARPAVRGLGSACTRQMPLVFTGLILRIIAVAGRLRSTGNHNHSERLSKKYKSTHRPTVPRITA